MIEFCYKMKFSREETKAKVADKFGLEPMKAVKYMERFW